MVIEKKVKDLQNEDIEHLLQLHTKYKNLRRELNAEAYRCEGLLLRLEMLERDAQRHKGRRWRWLWGKQ